MSTPIFPAVGPDGKVQDKHLPERLSDTALANFMDLTTAEALIATKADQAAVDEMAPLHETAKITPDDGFRVRDKTGSVALSVTADGDTSVGGHLVRPSADVAFRIRDRDGQIALEVGLDGTINGLTGTSTPVVDDVRVILAAGQSNMAGYADPYDPVMDTPDPRIWEYGALSGRLDVAQVPLEGPFDEKRGLSPATAFARELIATLPETARVVIVMAAAGGTSFGHQTYHNWRVGTTGTLGLFPRMISQTTAALAAVEDMWGVSPRLEAMLWLQGEGDASADYAPGYQAALDDMLEATRTRLGVADLPILVGQMVPEWVAGDEIRQQIDAVHQSTPSRLPHTVFVPGLADSARGADIIHYSRTGAVAMGKGMFFLLDTARCNDEDHRLHPPLHLTAVKSGGVITATWSQPPSRISSYRVEWKDSSGAWAELPAQEVPGKCSATLPIGAVQVRVSTITPGGMSRATLPTNVQGV